MNNTFKIKKIMEATHMYIKGYMDKHNVVWDTTEYSCKKDGNSDIRYHVDEL